MRLLVCIFYLRFIIDLSDQQLIFLIKSFDRNISKKNVKFSFTFVYIINLRIIKAIHDRTKPSSSLEKFHPSVPAVNYAHKSSHNRERSRARGGRASVVFEAAVSGVQTDSLPGSRFDRDFHPHRSRTRGTRPLEGEVRFTHWVVEKSRNPYPNRRFNTVCATFRSPGIVDHADSAYS